MPFYRHTIALLALLAIADATIGASQAADGPKAAATSGGQIVQLWNGKARVDADTFEDADTRITVHLPPADKANGAAAVICPGGGYGTLVVGGEGHGIAAWLNSHGVAGIVLEYRLPKGRPFVPLNDAQRAVRTVRSRTAEWKIDPAKIGIIGFSAGGHLASTAATHFDAGNPEADDPIERVTCRPDFAILVYPVISFGKLGHGGSRKNLLGTDAKPELIELFSNELQVTKETPPIFLTHAVDDKVVVPEHSKLLHAALEKAGVATEYLELPGGGHGLNGYKGPHWDAWQAAAIKWLAAQGFLASSRQSPTVQGLRASSRQSPTAQGLRASSRQSPTAQ
jgi:acetyl esterase/lipase